MIYPIIQDSCSRLGMSCKSFFDFTLLAFCYSCGLCSSLIWLLKFPGILAKLSHSLHCASFHLEGALLPPLLSNYSTEFSRLPLTAVDS